MILRGATSSAAALGLGPFVVLLDCVCESCFEGSGSGAVFEQAMRQRPTNRTPTGARMVPPGDGPPLLFVRSIQRGVNRPQARDDGCLPPRLRLAPPRLAAS